MSESFAIGTRHKVLCSDGVTRVAQITNYPDTYFSVPARVKVSGHTVTGFVCHIGFPGEEVLQFTPNAWMRNAKYLPNWPEKCKTCHGMGTVLPADYYDTINRVGQDSNVDRITCSECKGSKQVVYPR